MTSRAPRQPPASSTSSAKRRWRKADHCAGVSASSGLRREARKAGFSAPSRSSTRPRCCAAARSSTCPAIPTPMRRAVVVPGQREDPVRQRLQRERARWRSRRPGAKPRLLRNASIVRVIDHAINPMRRASSTGSSNEHVPILRISARPETAKCSRGPSMIGPRGPRQSTCACPTQDGVVVTDSRLGHRRAHFRALHRRTTRALRDARRQDQVQVPEHRRVRRIRRRPEWMLAGDGVVESGRGFRDHATRHTPAQERGDIVATRRARGRGAAGADLGVQSRMRDRIEHAVEVAAERHFAVDVEAATSPTRAGRGCLPRWPPWSRSRRRWRRRAPDRRAAD